MLQRLLYTKKETCGSLGISARSLDYLIQQNVIAPIRFGRRVMVKVSDVQKLAQKGFRGRLNKNA